MVYSTCVTEDGMIIMRRPEFIDAVEKCHPAGGIPVTSLYIEVAAVPYKRV